MSHSNFGIFHHFVLLKVNCLVTLFDCKLQSFQTIAQIDHFWHFYWKCKRARFARNFECNFCSNWKKNEGGGLVSCWSEKMSLRHHRFSCLDTPSPIICACARLWLLSHHPWGWPYHGCSCRLAATWSFPLKCFDNGQNSSIDGFSWPCFARITKINFSSIF